MGQRTVVVIPSVEDLLKVWAETASGLRPFCIATVYWPNAEELAVALAICLSAACDGVEKYNVMSNSGSSMAVT